MATDIKKALHNGVVTFSYTKKDGSVRIAKGTTKHDTLLTEGSLPKGGYSPSAAAGYIPYYDLDKKGWRCFSEANLVDVIKVEA